MIEIEMSKDIRERDPKVISIFTSRQLKCILLACTYGVPFMIWATPIPLSERITIGVLLMAPVVACGWCDAYGMHLEQFIMQCLYSMILTPRKRKYKTENTYDKHMKKVELQLAKIAMEEAGKKEKGKKKAQKNTSKKKIQRSKEFVAIK